VLHIINNQNGMEVTSKHHGHHMDYHRLMRSLFYDIGLSPTHAADEAERGSPVHLAQTFDDFLDPHGPTVHFKRSALIIYARGFTLICSHAVNRVALTIVTG